MCNAVYVIHIYTYVYVHVYVYIDIYIYIYARYPKGQLAQLEANLGLTKANLRFAAKATFNARSNGVLKLPLR